MAPQWDAPADVDVGYWQRRLDSIAPPVERLSSLELVWMPGYPWQPIGRWIVYQLLPEAATPPQIRADLRGPNPADFARWDAAAGRLRRQREFLIDRYQWALYRETGRWARPYWVLQGEGGGHKRRLDDAELALIRARKSDPTWDVPPIGEQPYLAPSERMVELIAERDRMAMLRACLAYGESYPELLDAEDVAEQRSAREEIWRWYMAQFDAVEQEMGELQKGAMYSAMASGARQVHDGPDADELLERAEASFVEHGV